MISLNMLLLLTWCNCRVLIYEPVMEGRFVPAAASHAQLTGSAAAAPGQPTKPSQPAAKAAAPAGPEEDNKSNSSNSNSSSQLPNPSSKADSSPMSAVALTAGCHSQTAPIQEQQANSNGKDSPAAAAAAAPATDSRQSKQHRMLRRLAALQATFAFSGLWHLLIFYYATGLVAPHWFLFFSVQVTHSMILAAVQCGTVSM
jgi:hypothetical protein